MVSDRQQHSAAYHDLRAIFAALVLTTAFMQSMPAGELDRKALAREYRRVPRQVLQAAFGSRTKLVERLVAAIAATSEIEVANTASGLVLVAPIFKVPIVALADKKVLGDVVTALEHGGNERLLARSLTGLKAALAT